MAENEGIFWNFQWVVEVSSQNLKIFCKLLYKNAIKIEAKGRNKFLVHFWSKEDEFYCKLVGNIEPVKPEPQSPSPKISHFTKPDKARARTFGKPVSPSPKISGPDPTLVFSLLFPKVLFHKVLIMLLCICPKIKQLPWFSMVWRFSFTF